jgi:hypothetical protein
MVHPIGKPNTSASADGKYEAVSTEYVYVTSSNYSAVCQRATRDLWSFFRLGSRVGALEVGVGSASLD